MGSEGAAYQQKLPLGEVISKEGKSIDSTLPIDPNSKLPPFDVPKEKPPAWQKRDEFLAALDSSRLLVIKAPTGCRSFKGQHD